MSVWVWVFLCECRCPQRQEGVGTPGGGVTGGCEPPKGVLETEVGLSVRAVCALNPSLYFIVNKSLSDWDLRIERSYNNIHTSAILLSTLGFKGLAIKVPIPVSVHQVAQHLKRHGIHSVKMYKSSNRAPSLSLPYAGRSLSVCLSVSSQFCHCKCSGDSLNRNKSRNKSDNILIF